MHLLAERAILGALALGGLLQGDVEAMAAARLGAVFMPHGGRGGGLHRAVGCGRATGESCSRQRRGWEIACRVEQRSECVRPSQLPPTSTSVNVPPPPPPPPPPQAWVTC